MVYVLSVYNKKDKYNRVTVRDLSLSSLFLLHTISFTSWMGMHKFLNSLFVLVISQHNLIFELR